jgi:hypothetical protein
MPVATKIPLLSHKRESRNESTELGLWLDELYPEEPRITENRDAVLQAEVSFEQLADLLKKRMGFEMPVQDLDQLAAHTPEGIRRGDFIIMINREMMMEGALAERAKERVAGGCPLGSLRSQSERRSCRDGAGPPARHSGRRSAGVAP